MRQNLKEYLVPPPGACLKLPFSGSLKRSSEKLNLRLGGKPGQGWSKSLCCFNQTTLSGVAAAAAAAKSLQSCPTLCDPRDGSPPGSSIPGILQARTLEWVAIQESNLRPWEGLLQPAHLISFALQEGRLWGKPKCRHPRAPLGTLISEFSSRDTPGSKMTGLKNRVFFF